LVVLFLAFASADMSCSYYSSISDKSYSLENLAYSTQHWMTYKDDVDGSVWNWKVCDDGAQEVNEIPCPANSSVCVSTNGNPSVNRGSTYTALWSEIPQPTTTSNSGIEVAFGSDEACPKDYSAIKTVIDYVCSSVSNEKRDNQDYFITVDTNEACFTTITVYTQEACDQDSYQDGDYDSWEASNEVHGFFFPFITFGTLLIMSVLFTVMCCCCLIRLRRRNVKKAIAMKQFSNVAFQPIPQTHSIRQTNPIAQQPLNSLPSYNPYVMQPQNQQFVYYYPGQQQQMNPIKEVQITSDEKLAKELQSQFDRESRV